MTHGPSITGSPIIVKLKSVPDPFALQGSPQQDWGSGSLPPRYMIIWSGWLDSHQHGLRSERSSQLLTHSLNHGAGYGIRTRDTGLEDQHVAATPSPRILLSWSGGPDLPRRDPRWQRGA